ncbi:Ribosomal protein S18 acetylase RimI [Asanoa hainanensis]|uniref:Ribosomal protein S18 acetylase RimI n=1 Tax=Asanoa hainanensis TaxID=560556 RepID=A0A239P4H0_9ACTN|nr:GNAT family N-acetyltransferase [Asanoa hainanensis]SNT61643.1 Ribosomal protein S18 acetylase RimI [Asanoa hainanensis]
MPQVTLRPAREADIEALTEIWHRGWADGHLGNVPDALVAVRTPDTFRSRTADGLPHTTVALVGESIAGFVKVVDEEVEQVYVSATHRGSGVAGVLLGEAERQVAAEGYAEAWLAVAAGNARARRFYERSGWSDAGLFDYLASTADGPIPVPCHRYVKAVA